MSHLLDIATKYFEDNDWHCIKTEAVPVLQMAFKGSNGEWNCHAFAHEEHHRFVFYSICPVHIPQDKFPEMAELLTRINCNMMIGNFELDYKDGQTRFKTSIDVEGDRLSLALVHQLVLANVVMMDTYLPAIMKVIYNNVSPTEAVEEIVIEAEEESQINN